MSSGDSTVIQGAVFQLVKRSGRCLENSGPCNVERSSKGDGPSYSWKDRCYPFKGVLGAENFPDEINFSRLTNLTSHK